MAIVPDDVLAPLADLPGVREAGDRARANVDSVLWDRGVRGRAAEVAAVSRLRGGWATAAIDARVRETPEQVYDPNDAALLSYKQRNDQIPEEVLRGNFELLGVAMPKSRLFIMALCVPAAAWIEASALIVSLISIAALAIGVVLWWHWHESRVQKA